jgi:hypothetical protein
MPIAFSCELTLLSVPDGAALFAELVAELRKPHGHRRDSPNLSLKPGDSLLASVHRDLFGVNADMGTVGASFVTFQLAGILIRSYVAKQEISCAELLLGAVVRKIPKAGEFGTTSGRI